MTPSPPPSFDPDADRGPGPAVAPPSDATESGTAGVVVQSFRFGDYLQEVAVRHRRVRYGDVVDASPPLSTRVHVSAGEAYRILTPYVRPRFLEQLRAVGPLALYLVLFQLLFLRQSVEGGWVVAGALIAVAVGLMLFMEGLRLGLMPLGERIGATLPTRRGLGVVLAIVFLLGIGVTLAEPAIGALKAAGAIVDAEASPLLHSLLNEHTPLLIGVVGIGVGAAAVLGTLRFVYDWSLKTLIFASVLPCLVLTAVAAVDPSLREVIGLAWDSGAVTTGPVTVPLVLALGIGVASSVGRGSSSLSGFGIVTLASVFPVLGVLVLGLTLGAGGGPEPEGGAADGLAAAATAAGAAAAGWWGRSPWSDVVGALRAIVPLVLFLLAVLAVVVREKVPHGKVVAVGIILTLFGMALFNLGLSYGLAALGSQSGGALPAAFTATDGVPASPLYTYALGIALVVGFALLLGFGATLAEPALNALGSTVEELTNGAFPKKLLMTAVAAGVAVGIGLGVLKLVFGFGLALILVPGYALALILTALSTEEFVNVAWDSAGVTTGPVTVPLVLAMGLGLGEAVRAADGFGVLALASLCPITAVLVCGLYIQWKAREHVA